MIPQQVTLTFKKDIESFIDNCLLDTSEEDTHKASTISEDFILELKGDILRNREEKRNLGVVLLVEVKANNSEQILVFRQEDYWNNLEGRGFNRNNKDFNGLIQRMLYYLHQYYYFKQVNTIW